MNGKSLKNGLGVNFDDDPSRIGTGIRVGFKGAVIAFRTQSSLSVRAREQICDFLETRRNDYFMDDGTTVTAADTSELIDDLIAAGFSL